MNKLIKCLNLLKKFDLFPATQYLRYKQQPQYKTITGGFISIAIIIIFFILFYNLGVQTINQQIINGSVSILKETQPSFLEIQFKNGSDFMFVVGIRGLSLSNQTKKYFNVTMEQQFYGPLLQTVINTTTIPLVACTPQHFSYNADILSNYYNFKLEQSFCPPLNHKFVVGGRLTSQVYADVSIYLDYCNKTIDSACATDAELLDFQNLTGNFEIYIAPISTIINPGDQNYRQVYLEDRNYFYFTTTTGLFISAEIQEEQIGTDVSLMPYTNIQQQFVTTIPDLFIAKSKPVFKNRYVELIFSKSSTSLVYTRSFNKIDSYFSYVGGLVGTILMFFFILGAYSEQSYVINIASEIYRVDEDKSGTCSKSFHFLYFISIYIKKCLEFVRIDVSWKQPERFSFTMQEMQKQLNITYILKRMNFLDEAVSTILNQHQITTLYRTNKKSIKQAGIQRRKCFKSLKYVNNSVQNGQIRLHDSSNNILNLQLDSGVNRDIINIQNPKVQIQSSFNEQSLSSNQNEEQPKKAKESLIEVIEQSREGNLISRRILQKVSKKIFPEIFMQQDSNKNKEKEIEQMKANHQQNEIESKNQENLFEFNLS